MAKLSVQYAPPATMVRGFAATLVSMHSREIKFLTAQLRQQVAKAHQQLQEVLIIKS
jgi:hypothetical protein